MAASVAGVSEEGVCPEKSSSGEGQGGGHQSLSLRLQKKVAGKLGSRTVAKRLISDSTAALLDEVHAALKLAQGKKAAEKTLKALIKTVGKLAVLEREDEFSPRDREELGVFLRKFRSLMLAVVSFVEVEFSYERAFLLKGLGEAEGLLRPVAARHLQHKSLERLGKVFAAFADPAFLDPFFTKADFAQHRRLVAQGISKALEQGDL